MKKLLIILAIAAILMSGVPLAQASTPPLVVSEVNWISLNNTLLVAPGYSDVPLIAQLILETPSTVYNLNLSFNFSEMSKGVFTYSYIYGQNSNVRDYYNYPVALSGEKLEIYQLTNISAGVPSGVYAISIDYSFSEGNSTLSGNVTAEIAVLGTVNIIPAQAYFGVPGTPLQVTSNTNDVPVTIYLENDGNTAVSNVTITYNPQLPLSGMESTLMIPAIPAYYSVPVTFYVNVGPSNLSISQFLQISYFGLSHDQHFTLLLSGYPQLVPAGAEFNVGSLIAEQGMKNIPLSFYVEDDSRIPATNVTVEYTPTLPLNGVSQRTFISAIPQYGVMPVTFLVNVTGNETSFNQSLTLYYNNSYHTLTYKIILPGYADISIVNYYTNPPYVYEGEKFILLNVVIVNAGNSPSIQQNVSLSSSYFSVATKPYLIPSLYPGIPFNLTFLVSAQNFTGNAPLYLLVNNKNITLEIELLSKGSISIIHPAISVSPGSNTNLFVFDLTNTGSVTLVDLNIHILTPDVFYIDIPSSNPLGSLTADNITFSELNPGQKLVVTFVMDVESSATPENYPSQLFISYRTNESATPFFVTGNFNVTVQNTPIQELSSTSTLAYIVIIIAVVIIAGFAIVIRRMRKRKVKQEK